MQACVLRQELVQPVRQVNRPVHVVSIVVLTIRAALERGLECAEGPDGGLRSTPPIQCLSRLAKENEDGEVAWDQIIFDLDQDAPLAADRCFD